MRETPASTLLGAISEALRTGLHTDTQSFVSLITQAFDALSCAEETPIQNTKERSLLTHVIVTALHTLSDNGLPGPCVSQLLSLGSYGELATAHLVQTQILPHNQCLPLVQEQNTEKRLLWINRLLATPHELPLRLLHHLRRETVTTLTDDPESGLIFLEQLYHRQEKPCYALSNAMQKTRFGLWLEELLHMNLEAEQLGYIINCLTPLTSSNFSSLLLRHLKRVRGTHRITLLRYLGECTSPDDSATRKTLIEATQHANAEVRTAAITALVQLGTPEKSSKDTLPEVLATLFNEKNDENTFPQEYILLLLTLPITEILKTLRYTKSALRPRVISKLAGLLAHYDQAALTKILQQQDITGKEHVHSFLMAHSQTTFSPVYEPAKRRKTPPHENITEKNKNIFKELRQILTVKEEPGDSSPHPLENCNSNNTQADQTFTDAVLVSFSRNNIVFSNCTFLKCDLSFANFTNCTFEHCTFTGVRFSESAFKNVRFTQCTFTNIPSERCLWQNVQFFHCTFTVANLGESRLSRIAWHSCTLSAVRLWGSILKTSEIRQSTLRGCDLGYCQLHRVDISQSEFFTCQWECSDIQNSMAMQTDLMGCVCTSIRIQNITTLCPELREAEEQWEKTALGIIAEETHNLPYAKGNTAIFTMLKHWLSARDVRRRQACMLAHSSRRYSWCTLKLGKKSSVIEALPLLFSLPLPSYKKKKLSHLAVNITGYTPTVKTVRAAKKLGLSISENVQGELIQLESVFLVGESGTIAQTPDSPLDCWIIHTLEDDAKNRLSHFQKKLCELEKWIWEKSALRLRFHCLHQRAIQQNTFGFETHDLAGESHAKFMKAELYSTAILVAGRPPMWWQTEMSNSTEEEQNTSTTCGPPLDLGPLTSIEHETLVSALFWFIARALENPFLALLAFGMLEKHIVTSQKTLLCNQIKYRVHAGQKDIWQTDPLAVPLREIFLYYQKKEDIDALNLLRQTYAQKCGYTQYEKGTELHLGSEFVEFFFPVNADAAGRKLSDATYAAADTQHSFADIAKLGEDMNKFLLKTYIGIREKLGTTLPQKVHSQDITKAGRRIQAWLSPKKNKILRLPFIDPPHNNIMEGIEFSSIQHPTQKTLWQITTRRSKVLTPATSSTLPKTTQEVLYQHHQLPLVLCWLHVNALWQPDIEIRGSSLEAPVSLLDLKNVLSALQEAFPLEQTFTPAWENYLEEEVVTRSLAIINLTTPRDKKSITEVTLLYATNWGEMFCIPQITTPKQRINTPGALLREQAHCPVQTGTLLPLHLPYKVHVPASHEIIL